MKSANQLDKLLQKAQEARAANNQERCIQLCRKILKTQPRHPPTLWLIGLALHQSGRTDEAIRHYESLAKLTKEPKVLANLALLYQKAGRADAAEKTYRQLLDSAPDAQAWNNLGTLYHARHQTEKALACYRQALELEPNRAESGINLALALQAVDDLAESERLLNQLADKVADAQERFQVASALERVNVDAALALHQEIAAQNSHGPSWYALALINYKRGLSDTARTCAEEALKAQPDLQSATFLLAELLAREARPQDAIALLRRSPASPDRDARITALQGSASSRKGHLSETLDYLERAYRHAPDNFSLTSHHLFHQNYSPTIGRDELFRLHRKCGQQVGRDVRGTLPAPPPVDLSTGRRLRIGMVSGDFRQHAVSFFLINLLENIDRSRFELFAYANMRVTDDRTQEIKAEFEHWRAINDVEDLAAARLIRRDGIDVLIDLAGYTTDTRLPVFAARPAPIQINWIGYLNTTGLPEMDYRISDPIADPESEANRYCTEQILRMPETYLNFKPLLEVDIASAPCAESGQITFASFNTPLKHNDPLLKIWADILKRVDGSRLLLKDKAYSHESVVTDTIRRMQSFGVAEHQLEFLTFASDMADHLATYNRVDIALDPFPYNGITTSCDALWMGVPLICLEGDRHSARVSASLARSLELDDLVATSAQDYVERACALAANMTRIQEYKQVIRKRFQQSALGNGQRFTQQFEALLLQAVEGHAAATENRQAS